MERQELSLDAGDWHGLAVQPRWPSQQVRIDAQALAALQRAQARLPAELRLVLTRAYEEPRARLGRLRWLSRRLGMALFLLLYPSRRAELQAIFGSNGHDRNGRHVDVALRWQGHRLRPLPLSVFTPPRWQQGLARRWAAPLAAARAALEAEGYTLHSNPTEALQIHADFAGSSWQG